jgi:hypothetical protein
VTFLRAVVGDLVGVVPCDIQDDMTNVARHRGVARACGSVVRPELADHRPCSPHALAAAQFDQRLERAMADVNRECTGVDYTEGRRAAVRRSASIAANSAKWESIKP